VEKDTPLRSNARAEVLRFIMIFLANGLEVDAEQGGEFFEFS
jgi:hypothetical protein